MSRERKRRAALRLEAELRRQQAAQRRQFVNYDRVVRDPKTGNLSYESVRTVATPRDANFLTETPVSPENGQLIAAANSSPEPAPAAEPAAEVVAAAEVAAAEASPSAAKQTGPSGGISEHEGQIAVQQLPEPATRDEADPLHELLAQAQQPKRRGRPALFDEQAKGQIVAMLALGMSLRQAGAVLGVSHNTVRNALQADPALAEQITAARFQAQLQPLACVIREARRSWKAATWLLKYLDGKLAAHEETPDERRARIQQENEEFLAWGNQRSKTVREKSR